MRLFKSCFIYCNSAPKRQTSIIFGPDPKRPCGQSEPFEARQWQELNPRSADLEAGMLTLVQIAKQALIFKYAQIYDKKVNKFGWVLNRLF